MTKQPPIAKADLQKTQENRAPAAIKNNDVISFINQPSMKEQLAAALPRHRRLNCRSVSPPQKS